LRRLDLGSLLAVNEPLNTNPGRGGTRRKWYQLTFPEQLERTELRRRARHARSLKPGERPEPSLPAGTDLLPQIKHIVVLMMENHSYDNYLGMLDGRGRASRGTPAASPT